MGLLAFLVIFPALTGSTGLDSLDSRLDQTRLHLEELENREASSEDILVAIHDHLQAARDYYNQLAAREAVLALEIQSIDQRWFLTDSARTRLREGVEEYILFLYSRRDLLGPVVLFTPGGVGTYLRRMAVVDHMAGVAAQRMERLEQSGDSLAWQRDSLEALAADVRDLRIHMEEVQERIYLEEERQTLLRQSLQNQIAAARDSAAAMEQRRRQLSSFVSSLSTGVASSGAAPVHDLSSTAFLAVNGGRIPWPVRGSVVRSFGTFVDPTYGTETISDGISIAVTGTSADVSAIAPGEVLYAREFLNMGRMVVVDHLDGYYTVYAHLGSLDVGRGEAVQQGTRLGTTGPLPGGRSGCYLEVRRAGEPVNPMSYLENTQ